MNVRVPSQVEPVVLLMVSVPSDTLAVMVLLWAEDVFGLVMVIVGAVVSNVKLPMLVQADCSALSLFCAHQ